MNKTSRQRLRETKKPLQDLLADFEAAAQLLTELEKNYPSNSKERRLLLLLKDASFFVYLRQIKVFAEFLQEMENGPIEQQLEKLKNMGIKL